MTAKYGMHYSRPEMQGLMMVEPAAIGIDWSGMAEMAFVGAGFAFLALFGDTQMLGSFLGAFSITLAMTR